MNEQHVLPSIKKLLTSVNGKLPPERLLTVREAAEYLRLSKSYMYVLLKRREIPHIKLSERRMVIREMDLMRWVIRNYIPGVIDDEREDNDV